MSPSDLPAAGNGVICQNPLAYLVGVEGVALLRAFAGDYDREFIDARLAEIRLLLESADQIGDIVLVEPITTAEGYDGWSIDYDEPGNALAQIGVC